MSAFLNALILATDEFMLSSDACPENQGFSCGEVLAEIRRLETAKKSWKSNLTMLLVSMVIFYNTSKKHNNMRSLIFKVSVLKTVLMVLFWMRRAGAILNWTTIHPDNSNILLLECWTIPPLPWAAAA